MPTMQPRWILLGLTLALAFAGCDEAGVAPSPQSDGDTDTDTDTDTDGDSDGDSDADSDSDLVMSCGDADCASDLAAAMDHLKAGRFQEAYEAYSCADTPEAAFGAALSAMVLTVETDAVTHFLARGGYGPASATDFAGPDGLLYRGGRYWDGTASFTLSSADGDIPFAFSVVHSDADDDEWNIDASKEGVTPDYDLWFEASPTVPVAEGDIVEISYDCDGTGARDMTLVDSIWLDVDLRLEEQSGYYCSLPRSATDGSCPDRVGRIAVEAMGGLGDPAVYRFEDVAMRCTVDTWEENGVSISVSNGDDSDTFIAYLSGVVETRLTELKTDDLHPFINDPEAFFEDLPETYSLNDAISDAAPLADHFETIACFAAQANNNGAEPVFEIPEELIGRSPVSVSTSDAKIAAAGFLMSAAAIRIAESYSSDMRLRAMADMTDQEIADEINGHIPALKANHKFKEARRLMKAGLELAEDALTSMDADGLLVLDKHSEAGRARLHEWTVAALASLEEGETIVPRSEPPITVNLRRFFMEPPDPSQIEYDAVVVEWDEDWSYIEGVEAFYKELLGDTVLNFDFDMEDNGLFSDPGYVMEDFVESVFGRTCDIIGCS